MLTLITVFVRRTLKIKSTIRMQIYHSSLVVVEIGDTEVFGRRSSLHSQTISEIEVPILDKDSDNDNDNDTNGSRGAERGNQ